MKFTTAWLLLGGNLGNREANLAKGREELQKIGSVFCQSSLYETAPWGIANQPPFLNQAVGLVTTLTGKDLMDRLLEIEAALGRSRNGDAQWGARTLDIDILYFGNAVVASKHLSLPHPRMHERRFALVPLCEIASAWKHPIFRLTNAQLLANCTDDLDVKKVS